MLNQLLSQSVATRRTDGSRRQSGRSWLVAFVLLVLVASGCGNTAPEESGAALEPVAIDNDVAVSDGLSDDSSSEDSAVEDSAAPEENAPDIGSPDIGSPDIGSQAPPYLGAKGILRSGKARVPAPPPLPHVWPQAEARCFLDWFAQIQHA